MNAMTRDLRSVLEEIAEEDGRAAALTPARADAELAALTSRIRRRRALNGAVATTGAVAAAGVIGAVVISGIGSTPNVEPAALRQSVPTAAPSPQESSPSTTTPTPTPTPTTVPEDQTPPEPAVPGAVPLVTEAPAPPPDDPEAMARAVFGEYLDAWRRGDSETLRRLSDLSNSSWAGPLDYTPVLPELYCAFHGAAPVDDEYPTLECDVDLVGSTHFIMRVSIQRTADGQWLAHAGEMGVG